LPSSFESCVVNCDVLLETTENKFAFEFGDTGGFKWCVNFGDGFDDDVVDVVSKPACVSKSSLCFFSTSSMSRY